MNGIAAETYLRHCAEDELRTDHDEDEEPRGLGERIRALVFIGLLDAEVGSGIASSYGRARALRGLGSYPGSEHDVVARAAEPIRVSRCSGEIDISGTTIVPRLVSLGEHRTRLAATIRAGSAGGPRRRRRRPPPFFDVDEITLRDDKGRSVTAHLSGGSSGGDWRGWYEAESALSPDAAWIEVEGTRLVLDDTNAGATVTVETFADAELAIADRAVRYLDHCAHNIFAGHEAPILDIVADTFVTCGALAPDSSAVTSALGADEGGAPYPTVFPGRGWAGFQSPHTRRGRQSTMAPVLVGATTPLFDGVSITVIDLEGTPDGFQIDIDGVGPIGFGYGYASVLGRPRLSMRATDDLGNHYHGLLAESDYGSEGFSGTVQFTPAVNEGASIVNLEFSTERARAVMHVPLQSGGRP